METRPAKHPTAEILKAFGLGKLDDNSSGALMAHLDLCADCRKIVASQSGDDFLDRLRQAHSRNATPAPPKSLGGMEGRPKPPPGPTTLFNLPPELADNPSYEILRELGRGGMGVVYLAKNKLMDRLEVLKVINKALLDRAGAVERFLREIRSAAKLNHVNVVAAYSALQLGDLLVFAMEYVEGQDLAAVLKANGPLPVAHACFYVQQAAQGLQHAFEKKMVHRDIKPQNLILAREGRKHLVKVLDFGLAKVMREKSDDTGLTGEGKMLGTPDYMAPEQTLDATSADIRADIYSLGCTLYFLLSGNRPFKGKNLYEVMQAHQSMEAPGLNVARPEVPAELADVVRKMMAKERGQRYQTPLEVVGALSPFIKRAAASPSSPGLSVPGAKTAGVQPVKTESSSVPSVSAKQPPPLPVSRPPAAWDSLTDSVIAARQSAKSGTVGKRSWLLTAGPAAGLLLLGLLGYWLATIMLRVETANGTLVVEINGDEVEARIKNGNLILTGPDGKIRYTLTAKDRNNKLEAGPYKIRVEGADGLELDTPEFTLKKGGEVRVRVTLKATRVAKKEPPNLDPDRKAVPPRPSKELDALRRDQIAPEALAAAGGGDPKRAPASLVGVLGEAQPIHSQESWGLAYSPDGRWLASGSADKTIMLRDTATGRVKRILRSHTGGVFAVGFSKDGRTLVSAGHDGTLRLWSVDNDEQPTIIEAKLGHPVIWVMAISPDGRFVAAAGNSGLIKLWKWGVWEKPIEITDLKGKVTIRALAFSPDGELLACGGSEEKEDARVRIYATADGKEKRKIPNETTRVTGLSFSHDGKYLAAVRLAALKLPGGDGRVWEVATGKEVARLTRPTFPGEWNDSGCVAWSPDDKTLAVGTLWRVIVYDFPTGARRTLWFGLDQAIASVRFSPHGDMLAAGGSRADMPVWDTTSWKLKYLERGHTRHVRSLAISPDGQELLSLGNEMAMLRWPLARPGKAVVSHLDFGSDIQPYLHCVAYGRDGKTCIAPGSQLIAVRNTVTEKETGIRTLPMGLDTPAVSPDGRIVAAGESDGHLHLWDLALGRDVHRFPTKGRWRGLAFRRDGVLLASCDEQTKRMMIWNAATGNEVNSWEVKSPTGVSAFHPQGKTLATGHEDGSILLWDAATGKKRQTLAGHAGPVRSLKFTADGKTLVSSGNDGIIRLWNPEQPRAREIIPLGPANQPLTFDLDRSGRYLFAAGHSPVIFILRLP